MSGDIPSFEQLEALGPARAAAIWLERLARQELDGTEVPFQQWLNASEDNRIAWERAIELWDGFDDDEDALFGDMRREALAFQRQRDFSRWLPYAAAASILLVIVAALLLGRGPVGGQPADRMASAEHPDPRSFGVADHVTLAGQRSTISLADGSKVTLEPNSAVDVAFRDGLRMARLMRGQAFFDVAHDAAHPFRVAAGGRVISVLGTRFDVRTSRTEMRVLLVQGSIEVSRGEDPAHPSGQDLERLSPGQQLVARAGTPDRISNATGEAAANGEPGFVQFDRQTLAEALVAINHHANRKLVIRDPWVADLKISGAFPAGDTASFVETITALYPLRAVATAGGELEIVRKR